MTNTTPTKPTAEVPSTPVVNIQTLGSFSLVERLAANPDATYMDLYGTPDGMSARIGGLEFSNLNQSLNAPAKHSATSVKNLLAQRAKLEEIAFKMGQRLTKLNAQLESNARKALRKTPGGKAEVAAVEEMQRLNGIQIFTNPLEVGGSAQKRRDGEKVQVLIRLAGSAVTEIQDGESAEAARERLIGLITDQREVLASYLGIERNVNDVIQRAVRPVTYNVPVGQVGVAVYYGLVASNPDTLRKLVDKLALIPELAVLDPVLADNRTLQINSNDVPGLTDLDADEFATEPETELDVDLSI